MNRKIIFLAIGLIFVGVLAYASVQLFKIWQYQLSLNDDVWVLDESRKISYAIPPDWVAESDDENLFIHTKSLHSDNSIIQPIWLRARLISSDEVTNSDLSNNLEYLIPSYFDSVKDYTVTDMALQKVDGYQAVSASISAEWFVNAEDPLAEFLNEEGVEPKLLVEHELTLVDYHGEKVLIDTMWRSGDPEYNSANYQNLSAIRESIQFQE